jgi:hypothetical protein
MNRSLQVVDLQLEVDLCRCRGLRREALRGGKEKWGLRVLEARLDRVAGVVEIPDALPRGVGAPDPAAERPRHVRTAPAGRPQVRRGDLQREVLVDVVADLQIGVEQVRLAESADPVKSPGVGVRDVDDTRAARGVVSRAGRDAGPFVSRSTGMVRYRGRSRSPSRASLRSRSPDGSGLVERSPAGGRSAGYSRRRGRLPQVTRAPVPL